MNVTLRVEHNATTTVEESIEWMFHEVTRYTGRICTVRAKIVDRESPTVGHVKFTGAKKDLAALVLAYANGDHVEAKFVAPQLFTTFV